MFFVLYLKHQCFIDVKIDDNVVMCHIIQCHTTSKASLNGEWLSEKNQIVQDETPRLKKIGQRKYASSSSPKTQSS